MNHYHLTFPGRLEALEQVAEFVQQACHTVKSPELPGDFIRNVGLVVSEAVTNAIRHGTRSQDDQLTISVDIGAQSLIIRVRDHGPGFDINTVAVPDLDQPAEGGYGVYIIKTLMDEVSYIPVENGNELIMKKHFGI